MPVPDEGALLQQLSAQIQRDVLAVHHTCKQIITFVARPSFFFSPQSRVLETGIAGTSQEAQPFGQDVGGFGLDQDLPAVQRHAGAHLPAHVKHARLLCVCGWRGKGAR